MAGSSCCDAGAGPSEGSFSADGWVDIMPLLNPLGMRSHLPTVRDGTMVPDLCCGDAPGNVLSCFTVDRAPTRASRHEAPPPHFWTGLACVQREPTNQLRRGARVVRMASRWMGASPSRPTGRQQLHMSRVALATVLTALGCRRKVGRAALSGSTPSCGSSKHHDTSSNCLETVQGVSFKSCLQVRRKYNSQRNADGRNAKLTVIQVMRRVNRVAPNVSGMVCFWL